MHNLLEKILDTAILLMIWCSGALGVSEPLDFVLTNTTNGTNFISNQNIIFSHFLNKRKIGTQLAVVNNTIIGNPKDSFKRRSDQPRNYYNSVPTAPFIQAFDPISVLASLAFLAFLLQSFAALFDRTRSLIPTIINSRQANYEYDEQVADMEKIVLRALKDYANLGKN